MSPPAQKARPPALAMTTRATRASRSKSSSAAAIARTIGSVSALSALRSVEEDEAGRAAAFGANRRIVARRGGFRHFTFANAASMAAATSAIAAMPSTSCNAPLAA